MYIVEQYNKQSYYYFNGALNRFRDAIDPTITKDELTTIFHMMRFPVKSTIKTDSKGNKTTAGQYSVDIIENWLSTPSKLDEIKISLDRKRQWDTLQTSTWIQSHKKVKPVYTNKSIEELQAEDEENRRKLKTEYEKKMFKRLEDEAKRLPPIEDEEMEKVSDKLLQKDEVYYN